MKLITKIMSISFLLFIAFDINSQEDESKISSSVLIEEVVVTARKKEESAQSVPVALTALNQEQLEILKFRDFNDLSVGIPNVAMDDIGTTKGTQNFSIRGIGINSSIASVEPAVAIVVDGVYTVSYTHLTLPTKA